MYVSIEEVSVNGEADITMVIHDEFSQQAIVSYVCDVFKVTQVLLGEQPRKLRALEATCKSQESERIEESFRYRIERINAFDVLNDCDPGYDFRIQFYSHRSSKE